MEWREINASTVHGGQTKRATSLGGGGPPWRLGRHLIVMGSPCCVEPAFSGEWHASVGDTNRAPLPLAGVSLVQPRPFDRHGDLVPRGTGLKAYARRLGTARKAHRGERGAAVGGRTLSGGVRSSIEHLLLSKRCYTRLFEVSILVGTAKGINGATTGSRLSGTGCAANFSRMHGSDAMLGLFPPAAVGAGVEMGHQPIQHIEHALRKHRTLALLALTHLNPPIFFTRRSIHNKAPIRFFQRSGQFF